MNSDFLTIYSPKAHEHQVFWINYDGKKIEVEALAGLKSKLSDSIDQELLVSTSALKEKISHADYYLVNFKAGVTDNPAHSFKELLQRDKLFAGRTLAVHSGVITQDKDVSANPFVQEKSKLDDSLLKLQDKDFSLSLKNQEMVKTYLITTLGDEDLNKLSVENCWALSLDEMKIIQDHYKSLKREPTDVEIEMLAQTWSEHCKHKIFNAEIEYEDSEQKFTVRSLFKDFIKKPTHDMNKPWAVSLFDDNAGVVRFREGMDICIKVETHNSPSALDPYGGALTGILGVNRDIMGTGLGAKPVANTNVFCVGMPHEKDLPKTLLHPQEILKGIHKGVMDGGNKSGIPTVNGAIYFDESYSGKPLVYCGTVGIIPPEIKGLDACKKGQRPGDLVVMVGGGVGIDGIHGATASSLVMDKNTTLGMVQIGDPFSQKRMMDFLLAARDELLYNSITDNGAGGLSSSVGEMAGLTNGAILHLDQVPLKYAGLLPWQILVSESQERMTLSVSKDQWNKLKEMSELYQVNATVVGEFTGDGNFICDYQGKEVCRIPLSFLHDGLPKMKLKAKFTGEFKGWKSPAPRPNIDLKDHGKILQTLISHPSLASKEKWIRQYDHEVQGGTVVKPMEGLSSSAPNDAGVLWYGAYGMDGYDGFAVASGLCPHFSIDDTKLMTKLAVDEAVRNLICHGADPEKVALVDNFCWPDPTPSKRNPDAEFKLAQLVRSCMGLKEIMEIYQMPLVSGKDSMKNDYHGENLKISVLPTLLVTALGHVPDVRNLPKSQVEPGNLIYRIGEKQYEHYFGHFIHAVTDIPRNNRDEFNWQKIRDLYQKIFMATQTQLVSSCHDISEGGFLAALFETLMMNNLGLEFKVSGNEIPYLYSELPGHFVVSIKPSHKDAFEKIFDANEIEFLGTASDSGKIKFNSSEIKVSELEESWRNV